MMGKRPEVKQFDLAAHLQHRFAVLKRVIPQVLDGTRDFYYEVLSIHTTIWLGQVSQLLFLNKSYSSLPLPTSQHIFVEHSWMKGPYRGEPLSKSGLVNRSSLKKVLIQVSKFSFAYIYIYTYDYIYIRHKIIYVYMCIMEQHICLYINVYQYYVYPIDGSCENWLSELFRWSRWPKDLNRGGSWPHPKRMAFVVLFCLMWFLYDNIVGEMWDATDPVNNGHTLLTVSTIRSSTGGLLFWPATLWRMMDVA